MDNIKTGYDDSGLIELTQTHIQQQAQLVTSVLAVGFCYQSVVSFEVLTLVF